MEVRRPDAQEEPVVALPETDRRRGGQDTRLVPDAAGHDRRRMVVGEQSRSGSRSPAVLAEEGDSVGYSQRQASHIAVLVPGVAAKYAGFSTAMVSSWLTTKRSATSCKNRSSVRLLTW